MGLFDGGSKNPRVGDSFVFQSERYTIQEITRPTFQAVRKLPTGHLVKPTGNLADLQWHERSGAWLLPGCEGDLTRV